MAGRAMSFSFNPRTERAIEQRSGRAVPGRVGEIQISRSAALHLVVQRYEAVMLRHRPELTEAEWSCLQDVLAGSWLGDDHAVELIPHTVRDALVDADYAGKWGIDPARLLARINKLDYAGYVAIADELERRWTRTCTPAEQV